MRDWPARFRGAILILTGMAPFTGCQTTAPPTPLAQLNPQQQRGHSVFEATCAQCHYDRQDSPLHGPPLLGLFKKKSLPSGAPANDERVTHVIVYGRNMMPPRGGQLSASQLADLLAYLHTL